MNTNNNTNNNTTTNNITNNTKMSASRSIKVNFQGASRDVDLPARPTLAGLQAAVASTFGVELPARSFDAGSDSDLSFTYRDPDGDDVVFDKDSELLLALRLCPNTLEISAARNGKEPANPDAVDKLYKVAARNLREYHGVPSMTPVKLTKTLTLFKLPPRRLVRQGLAPKRLLADKKTPVPLGDSDNNEDLAEAVTADMCLMSMEDDKKEWNDGFVSVDNGQTGCDENKVAPVAVADVSPAQDTRSDVSEKDGGKDNVKPKRPVYDALLAAGVTLRPREVRPLLLALAVEPRRLVRLGIVNGQDLRAMLEKEKRRGRAHRSARGPWPPAAAAFMFGAHGPCGHRHGGPHAAGGKHGEHVKHKPCGPMRRHGGPHVRGMFSSPTPLPRPASARFADAGPGACRGPHPHRCHARAEGCARGPPEMHGMSEGMGSPRGFRVCVYGAPFQRHRGEGRRGGRRHYGYWG